MEANVSSLRIQSANPMHIVLLADNSGSMAGPPAAQITEGVQNWIYELQMKTRGTRPYFSFSLVLFGSSSEIVADAVGINDVDPAAIVIDGQGGTTNLTLALVDAAGLVQRHAQAHHCPPFVFLYTDGNPDDVNAALAAADRLKRTPLPCGAARLVTLGFGTVNDQLLQRLATSPEFYKRVSNSEELSRLLPAIGTPTQKAGGGTVIEFERQIAETNI